MPDKSPPPKKSVSAPLIGGIALAVAVGIAVGVFVSRGGQAPEEEPGPRRNVLVNEENYEEVIDDFFNMTPVQPGYYEVTMNNTWTFPNGADAPGDGYVENAASNSNDVYFDLLLSDTRETIYESPVIPLGGYMRNFSLDTKLDPGAYECDMVYHLVNERQETQSTLTVGVTVIVE